MSGDLSERDWRILLGRIGDGKCTPFLGAGACHPPLPLGSEIARAWAQQYAYPLGDCHDLPRVAQFVAVKHDFMFPKEEIIRQYFEGVDPPDFTEDDEPHGVLADLPLPIYMTTNYDDFMIQALASRKKAAKREICCWNRFVEDYPSVFRAETHFEPTAQNPVVYHLHGCDELRESIVLTEDDYFDFVVRTSQDPAAIPERIQRALAYCSLIFIGYSLEDWNFRVLFRSLVASVEKTLRRISVTVQLEPPKPHDELRLSNGDRLSGTILEDNAQTITMDTDALGTIAVNRGMVDHITSTGGNTSDEKDRQKEYLHDYFDKMDFRVYWGTAREFAVELREKWEAHTHGNGK